MQQLAAVHLGRSQRPGRDATAPRLCRGCGGGQHELNGSTRPQRWRTAAATQRLRNRGAIRPNSNVPFLRSQLYGSIWASHKACAGMVLGQTLVIPHAAAARTAAARTAAARASIAQAAIARAVAARGYHSPRIRSPPHRSPHRRLLLPRHLQGSVWQQHQASSACHRFSGAAPNQECGRTSLARRVCGRLINKT